MSPTRQWGRTTWTLALVTLALLSIVAAGTIRLAFYSDEQKQQKEVAQAGQAAEQADKKDLAAEVKKVCDAGGEPAKKLGSLCSKAKEIIQEPTKTVEPGLNETQVRNVVREEVARSNLVLTPAQINTVASAAAKLVPKPKDGKTPTKAELQPLASAALATFCANDACRGKDGADAPPVTGAQLTATLAAWCETRNGCVGDDGENGTNGTNGADGRSVVVSVEPVATGNKVTFSYTGENPPDPVSFIVVDGKDGEPGPTCPEGSTLQKQQVVTDDDGAGPGAPTYTWIQACVLTEAP